jgi:phosphoribosylformylglycinamidine synthase
VPADTPEPSRWLFGEDQGRYLIETAVPDTVLQQAKDAGVQAAVLGQTGGMALTVTGEPPISLDDLRDAHEGWLPRYMANE